MSRTLNKVILIGNVGKKPELKYTPSGVPVATFRIATSETWKDKNGQLKEQTDWHTIVAWRGLAEIVKKFVDKGTRVYVEGKLTSRTFDDKNGTRKYFVEVLADNILLLDAKRREHGKGYEDDIALDDEYEQNGGSYWNEDDDLSYDTNSDNKEEPF
jgi:single-strand DNA-binding protein